MRKEGENAPHFVAYRNYLGNTQFSGLLIPKIAKIKDVNEKGKVRAKFSVGVKDPSTGKYELEFVQVQFLNEGDRQVFSKVYRQLNNLDQTQ